VYPPGVKVRYWFPLQYPLRLLDEIIGFVKHGLGLQLPKTETTLLMG